MMKDSIVPLMVFLLLSSSCSNIAPADEYLSINPDVCIIGEYAYALVGYETRIYYDNIIIDYQKLGYKININSDIGICNGIFWSFTPSDYDIGTHEIQITVSHEYSFDYKKTIKLVVNSTTGISEYKKILLIGDSLTAASIYPGKILSWSNNDLLFFNLKGSSQADTRPEGVFHEGYGGWKYLDFLEKLPPESPTSYRDVKSPFLYQNDLNQYELDFNQYKNDVLGGEDPDAISLLLGINDCFGFDSKDDALLIRVDRIVTYSNKLIAYLRSAYPAAKIIVCTPPPPNKSATVFTEVYGDLYPRDNWIQVLQLFQNRLLENTIADVVCQAHLNIDTTLHFQDAVHPNPDGYESIGLSIYSAIISALKGSIY